MVSEIVITLIMMVAVVAIFCVPIVIILLIFNYITRKPCPKCGKKPPLIRIPDSWDQFLWGGWTCKKCGHKFRSDFSNKLKEAFYPK